MNLSKSIIGKSIRSNFSLPKQFMILNDHPLHIFYSSQLPVQKVVV